MFDYILEKIRDAKWIEEPFRHIEINSLFTDEHFAAITQASEVKLSSQPNDRALITALENHGWKPIPFPGTTENVESYLKWHATRKKHWNLNTCEGFGMTYRLYETSSDIIAELKAFMESDAFKNALLEKFDIDADAVNYDAGIQKYLDGYEISPHPDIRRKALTYMVNINPSENSEDLQYHTHYMRLRDERRYVGTYWQHNELSERCWVPWDWATTEKRQYANNSIVLFAPNNDSIHAVRAEYDHLESQRTQLYGNFWFNESVIDLHPSWQSFVVDEDQRQKLKKVIPQPIKDLAKAALGRTNAAAGKRFGS